MYSTTRQLGMKMRLRIAARVFFAAGLGFFCAASPSAVTDRRAIGAVNLNRNAFEYAQELITQGHMIVDGKGGWHEHQPSPARENEFIREHGFEEYAKWHLGIDERHAENTKARYKFPYGDFKNVHRSALLAAKDRARQHSYSEIKDAAVQLLEMISPGKKQASSTP